MGKRNRRVTCENGFDSPHGITESEYVYVGESVTEFLPTSETDMGGLGGEGYSYGIGMGCGWDASAGPHCCFSCCICACHDPALYKGQINRECLCQQAAQDAKETTGGAEPGAVVYDPPSDVPLFRLGKHQKKRYTPAQGHDRQVTLVIEMEIDFYSKKALIVSLPLPPGARIVGQLMVNDEVVDYFESQPIKEASDHYRP